VGANSCPARSPYLGPLVYCVLRLTKEMVYSVEVATRDALLGHMVDMVDQANNRQRKLQRAKHAIRNRDARCVTAESWIVENMV
jgi:hypothetical protein